MLNSRMHEVGNFPTSHLMPNIIKYRKEIEKIEIDTFSELESVIKANFRGGQYESCEVIINEEIPHSENELIEFLSNLSVGLVDCLSGPMFEFDTNICLEKLDGKSTFTLSFIED